MQSEPLAQLVNCEKLKKKKNTPVKMDSEKPQPFVTIYCDIVEDTDASIDSDATINLVTPTEQTPSITPTTIEPPQSSPPTEKVSTHIFK